MPSDDIRHKMLNDPRALTEETAHRLIDALDRTGALSPVRRVRSSQIATAFLGSVGAALLFVGVENAAQDLPFVSNAWGSIFAGIVLLAMTGTLLARLGQESVR